MREAFSGPSNAAWPASAKSAIQSFSFGCRSGCHMYFEQTSQFSAGTPRLPSSASRPPRYTSQQTSNAISASSPTPRGLLIPLPRYFFISFLLRSTSLAAPGTPTPFPANLPSSPLPTAYSRFRKCRIAPRCLPADSAFCSPTLPGSSTVVNRRQQHHIAHDFPLRPRCPWLSSCFLTAPFSPHTSSCVSPSAGLSPYRPMVF
jgi:hypothetical protein